MKNVKRVLFLLPLALFLIGCSSKGSETQAESNNTENVAGKDVNSLEITYENLMSIPRSPQEDFVVQQNTDGGVTITEYKGNDYLIYIPEELDGLPVTKIKKYTFNNNATPKAVRLADNIRELEFGVFGNNPNLEIFVAGLGLEEIDDGVFIKCVNLKKVVLNEGLKEIGESAFGGTRNLKELIIPQSVEEIGGGAFHFTGNREGVIKGMAGSVAEKAAIDAKQNFVAID